MALLGKCIWEIMSSPNKLWVSVMVEKYLKGGSIFPLQACKGSPTWNSILKALNILQDGWRIKFGNGETRFWYDPWVFKTPLCDSLPWVDIHDDIDYKVRDFLVNDNWHLEHLYTLLPQEVLDAISSLKPFLVDDLRDRWIWNPCRSGQYTVRSAYLWLSQLPGTDVEMEPWHWIWKLKLPSNIQFFTCKWAILHSPRRRSSGGEEFPSVHFASCVMRMTRPFGIALWLAQGPNSCGPPWDDTKSPHPKMMSPSPTSFEIACAQKGPLF